MNKEEQVALKLTEIFFSTKKESINIKRELVQEIYEFFLDKQKIKLINVEMPIKKSTLTDLSKIKPIR